MQYIPWLISAVATIFAILTYARNGSKDRLQETSSIKESLLKANMKLDQVCSTTTETRADIKAQGKEMQRLEVRMTTIEAQMKTVFKKLEKYEEENQ